MRRTPFAVLFGVLLAATHLAGQCDANSPKLDEMTLRLIFADQAESVANAAKRPGGDVDAAVEESIPFLTEWAAARDYPKLRVRLVDLESDRWNKEASDAAGAAGSTSVTSKGSVASLFSFAVENGALTRTESGTTITFRSSPANVLAALRRHGWLEAGPSVPQFDGSFESIAKRFSFYVSFDPSRGNDSSGGQVFIADRQQFAGWGTRFEVINKRDPRHPAYRARFRDLMKTKGKAAAQQLLTMDQRTVKSSSWSGFTAITAGLATSIRDHATDKDAVLNDYVQAAPQFLNLMCTMSASTTADDQKVVKEVTGASEKVADLLTTKADLFNDIAKSFTLAVEYNFTKQANTNGTVPAEMTPTSATLPDLGNINVVASKGFSDGPEFTANASVTWFQNLPSGSTSGRIRDVRASGQIDFPLPEIRKIGKLTLSASGLYLRLLEEPLGQQVLVNDVAITQKGTIGLAQAKLTIPTRSAVSIPLSVTWASRTELIKESDVRGNIGITLDLDKLFAKGELQ